MDSMIASDVSTMLTDPFTSVAVVFGAQNARGVLNESEVTESPAGFAVEQIATTLELATGALAGLAVNSAITADGRNFKVRDTAIVEDGLVTRLTLARA